MREVLIMMRMKPQEHPVQRAEPTEYSKFRRSSPYTLWKALLDQHVEVQQLWQTEAFKHKRNIKRI